MSEDGSKSGWTKKYETALAAYDYVVNGKPAIEWIMDRYQFRKDPDSQIVNALPALNDRKRSGRVG